MSRTRILVVEDDFLIRMTLVEALSDAGFDVVEACSGEDAIGAVTADPAIALAMLDVQLGGGINGDAAARVIRQHRPDLPFLFTTGAPDSVRERGPQDALLAKPYRPSEACTAVAALLARAVADP